MYTDRLQPKLGSNLHVATYDPNMTLKQTPSKIPTHSSGPHI